MRLRYLNNNLLKLININTNKQLLSKPSTRLNQFHLTRQFHNNVLLNYQVSELSPSQYYQTSEVTMEHLFEQLEEILQTEDNSIYDIEYQSGVLTLKLGQNGTYVINKQPPNQQIWLSSPKSGPKRYNLDIESETWFYHRDDSTLKNLLETELSEVFNKKIELNI